MGIPKMIVTHYGSGIVRHETEAIKKVQTLAKERKIEAEVAYDKMEIQL